MPCTLEVRPDSTMHVRRCDDEDIRCMIHAGCPEAVHCAHARLGLPFPARQVFERLRDLGALADWWPEATAIAAAPPGVYGAGDVAVLYLGLEPASVRVIAYKPGRRIVLAMQMLRQRLLIDLRISGDHDSTRIDLSIETPRASTFLAQTLQGLRLGSLCRRAGQRLTRSLGQSLGRGF